MNQQLQQLKSFFGNYRSFHYRKRETILFAGDFSHNIFYITQGYVRSYISTPDGRELTIRLYRPDDIFSLRVALNNQKTSYFYQALTDLEVFRAPSTDFTTFLNQNPTVLLEVTKKFLDRVDDLVKRMEASIMGNAYEKIIVLLIFLAQGLGEFSKNTVTIQVPFTHQEMAALTGLTRETVTLEINRLKAEGLIAQDERQLKVLDLQKLKKSLNLFTELANED